MLLPRSSVEKKRSLSWLTEWLHKDVQHQRGSPRQRSEEAQIAQGAASTSTNSSLEWPYFDMTHGYPTVLSRWTKQIAFCTEKAVPEPLRTPSYVNAIVLRRNQNSRGEKKEKKIFEQIMGENFPNLIENFNLYFQETQQSPSRINRIKLLKHKNSKKNIESSERTAIYLIW